MFVGLNLFAQDQVVSIPNQVEFDKYWKLVDENIQAEEAFQEWIPVGESDELWTKSFGIQRYQLKEDYNLENFYKFFIETLSKGFEENKSTFNHEILSQNENHLAFSWWSDDAQSEIGREWVHLLKEDSHRILFVRFATKNSEISSDDDIWRDCITNAEFSDIADFLD